MNTKKILLLSASIALLAAGCSKSQAPVQAPPPAATSIQAPAAELDPQKDWIRFYPGESFKFNLLFPLAWWGDENGTDTSFVLRSRKGADGSRPDDVTLNFAVAPLTAKSLSSQVAANLKDAKDLSPVLAGTTDTGVPYAFAAFIDSAGNTASSFAVQYQGSQYIKITVMGNITLPYVGRMVQSIALIK